MMFNRLSVASLFPRVSVVALGLFLACAASTLHASVFTKWTFEASIPTTAGPHAAEVGTGTASGVHASSSTVWSNPVGNGSNESFSSNNWSAGDYYQFSTNSVGIQDIIISFAQTRSSTGPNDFALFYSTGGSFTSFASYVVPAETWLAATAVPASVFTFDLSALTALDDQASLVFRLVTTDTTAAAGSNRVDDFTVNATLIPTTGVVPEPASLLVWGGIGLLGFGLVKLKKKHAN